MGLVVGGVMIEVEVVKVAPAATIETRLYGCFLECR